MSGFKGSERLCRRQGVGAIPHATSHRGAMVLHAAEAALPLIADARAFLPTSILQMNPAAQRLAGRRHVRRFRSIINDETGRA
ncbi:hypothetical protein [Bradyrhizobium cosmicum]|uniref:hypothetical protein n=1 Tax=Bradyrhizobium cosmicum TaxID=1404864 RepID=UPI0028E763DF|nr:hypothetical protein [Bradyrhizobium cosmicum]